MAASIPTSLLTTFSSITAQGDIYADNTDSPSEQYYGYLSVIQDISLKQGLPIEQQTWQVAFEIVPKEWLDFYIPDKLTDTKKTTVADPPCSQLAIESISSTDFAAAIGEEVQNINEEDFYIITFGKVTGGVAAVQAIPGGKKGAGPYNLRDRTMRAKKATNTLFKRKLVPLGRLAVKALKKKVQPFLSQAIGVMNVGQSSCNLIYDINSNPVAYNDIGSPMFWYIPSAPAHIYNPGPCLNNNPMVILSHWDFDHFSLALRANNAQQIRNLTWVVPHQNIGFWALLVFNNLANRNVWPANLPGLLLNNINIIQCAPGAGIAADLNNTGLAVQVTVQNAPNPIKNALLPGDAVFGSIPGVQLIPGLKWIAAAHHGSNTFLFPQDVPAPDVAGQGRIAYSYGMTGNNQYCYNHPNPNAIQTYHNAGWGPGANNINEQTTAQNYPRQLGNAWGPVGNIMMCHNANPPNCGVPNCPFHAFPKQLI